MKNLKQFHQQMNGLDDTEFAEICKALGHPARIQILRHIMAEGGCVCGRIVKIMPLAQSTVSQHLKILKKARLVKGAVEGPTTCYCVDKEILAKLDVALGHLIG